MPTGDRAVPTMVDGMFFIAPCFVLTLGVVGNGSASFW